MNVEKEIITVKINFDWFNQKYIEWYNITHQFHNNEPKTLLRIDKDKVDMRDMKEVENCVEYMLRVFTADIVKNEPNRPNDIFYYYRDKIREEEIENIYIFESEDE
tara:strand:- start:39 stop:356 length:318 start_codon:yes stop_codon:yes gene_type:complete